MIDTILVLSYSLILYENINNKLYYRKITKNSDNINKSLLENNNTKYPLLKGMFGYYLAGLIEGDGSKILPITHRNQKGKLLYPKIKITFADKDAALAIKLQKVLGDGTLEYPKNTKYLNLLFQDVATILKIVVLINGKLRTPKIEALHRLINWLNLKLIDGKSNILSIGNSNIFQKLPLDSSSLSYKPWLTGFIEADVNFYSSFNINSKGIAQSISHYMRISQKFFYGKLDNLNLENINYSNENVMEMIRFFLDVKSVTKIKREKGKFTENSYEVRTSNKESNKILISYLNEYPSFSSKHQDFLCWVEIHNIRISKSYKSLDGTNKLIYLKNSMNTLRTEFNWNSLNEFYTV